MFRSNVSSKFLYFVGKVFDEKTGNVSNGVNGWQYIRLMSISECINYLVQFFCWKMPELIFQCKIYI